MHMFATSNCPVLSAIAARFFLPAARSGCWRRLYLSALTFVVIAGFNLSALGDSPATGQTAFVTRAKRIFRAARTRFLTEPTNTVAAWEFGRACFDLADLATNNIEKAGIAEQGIAACRQGITNNPASAPAHYYLGMTLGQLADTKRNLAALRMVKEMEREFKIACELDEHFDFAGPDRNLGLLYLEAPIIGSVGSRHKARQHLHRAVELAPDYPENRLNLVEACLKWGDRNGAMAEFKALEVSWPDAHSDFAGEAWARSWADWEKRLETALQKIKGAPHRLESPHARE